MKRFFRLVSASLIALAPLSAHASQAPELADLPAEVEGPPAPSTEPVSAQEEGLEASASFGDQIESVRWEVLAVGAAMTATRVKDVTKGGGAFHFKNEGWFGRNTESLGMDKLHHGWKTYVLTDVLQSMIANRTGNPRKAAWTGAALGLGIMTYAEVLDGFTARTGFSNQDMVVHVAGAGLSIVRNAVPGLRDKIDFRMELKPQNLGSRLRLIEQLADRKYLIATQLAGFKRFKNTPWRFAEVHVGYFGRGFSEGERARGDPLRRKLYVGVGFNIQQLFAEKPKSRVERLAKGAFDYIQLPWTAIHY